MPREYAIALLAAGALWIGCALFPRPVRSALGNGLHCMGRYPDLWKIPLAFGIVHGLFLLAAQFLLNARLNVGLADWITDFHVATAPRLAGILASALLPAAEATSAVFAIFTATFPLSAIGALALLVNANGILREIGGAVLRRFPRAGWAIVAGLVLSAAAAACRPVVFLLLPEAIEYLSYYGVMAIGAVAFVFEFLFGVFFLTYLMLMAHAWMRGLGFRRSKLLLVAARRTGFVLKWTLVLAALGLLLIVLPQFVALLFDEVEPAFARALRDFAGTGGVMALVTVTLLFCPVSAILVFHNQPLGRAMRESLLFLRAHIRAIVPFLFSVSLPFLAVSVAKTAAVRMFGSASLPSAAADLLEAAAGSFLSGWFIAAWVCLYKSRTSPRKEVPF